MNTIIFNDTVSLTVNSYNKSANFNGAEVSQSGYANVVTDSTNALYELAETGISSIKILHDETQIYESTNLVGHVTSISEYLNGDRMSIDINFSFE